MKNPKKILEYVLLTFTSVGQIIYTIFTYAQPVSSDLRNIGWIMLWISAVFGILPIIIFRKKGGVVRGMSYMHTTKLVEDGVYEIVRHPQYLSGIIMSIGFSLISPKTINFLFSIANIIQYILTAYEADKNNSRKFGSAYLRYKQKVPGLNLFTGMWRYVKRTIQQKIQ